MIALARSMYSANKTGKINNDPENYRNSRVENLVECITHSQEAYFIICISH